MPHQRLTCSGFVIASKTSSRGASKSRVRTISRSDGVDAANVLLFAACVTAMFLLLGGALRVPPDFWLQCFQVAVQTIEALLPERPVTLRPLRDVLDRGSLETARPPLGVAAPADETGPLQHAQVLRDGRHAHVERLGQLCDRAF